MSFRYKALLGTAIVASLCGLLALPAHSYLFNLTTPRGGGNPQMDRWDFSAFPVAWNLNPSTAGSHVSGTRSVTDVVQQSFAVWLAAPNATVQVSRGPDSAVTSQPQAPDNVNLICFVCSDSDLFPDSSVLGVTVSLTADAAGESDNHGGQTGFAGQILKADVLFNPAVQFSTDAGDGNSVQDLQAVATHEIGHFFGLGHSAVVRAMMFPAASDLHTLSYDDVAALSVLYPADCPLVATGSISGTVTRSGAGIFGAHVFAESITDAEPFPASIRKSPIGILTRPDGTYQISGLPADSYVVVAEPLDGPVTNDELMDYASSFNRSSVQTQFTTRWH